MNRDFYAHPTMMSSVASLNHVEVLRTIAALRAWRESARGAGYTTVGVVPTMGNLHRGHLSLASRSIAQCDATIVTIFVNPTQFGPGEDFGKYPRTLDADVELLRTLLPRESAQGDDDSTTSLGVPRLVVFAPPASEMAAQDAGSLIAPCHVSVHPRSNVEGIIRPHLFNAIATIVLRLFNMCEAHRCYFGQKDGFQCIIIRTMIRQLNLPLRFVSCPTVRDGPTGVALSSRNAYLSEAQMQLAPVVHGCLRSGVASWRRDVAVHMASRDAAAMLVNRVQEAFDEQLAAARRDGTVGAVRFDLQYVDVSEFGEAFVGALFTFAPSLGKDEMPILSPRVSMPLGEVAGDGGDCDWIVSIAVTMEGARLVDVLPLSEER